MKHLLQWVGTIGAACVIVLGSVIWQGCTKDSITDTAMIVTDESALKMMVASTDSVSSFLGSQDSTIDDDGTHDPDYEGDGISATITPLKWGRHIFWNLAVRHTTVEKEGDTAAVVTVTETIPGEFLIRIALTDSLMADSIIRKPFTEQIQRKIRFVRIAHTDEPERNWRPVAISLCEGHTLPDSANNFSISCVWRRGVSRMSSCMALAPP